MINVEMQTVLLALIAALPATIAAFGAWLNAIKTQTQTVETHKAVNSRMDELLRLARGEAAAQATLAEKDAQAMRDAVPKLP